MILVSVVLIFLLIIRTHTRINLDTILIYLDPMDLFWKIFFKIEKILEKVVQSKYNISQAVTS